MCNFLNRVTPYWPFCLLSLFRDLVWGVLRALKLLLLVSGNELEFSFTAICSSQWTSDLLTETERGRKGISWEEWIARETMQVGGRERSGRQLLGHCLPGVCTSVISQPLSSLATYRHTHAHTWLSSHTHPSQIPSVHLPPSLSSSPCLLLPCSVEQVKFTEAQILYIDALTLCIYA